MSATPEQTNTQLDTTVDEKTTDSHTKNIEVDEHTIDDLNLEERHTTADNVNSMFGVNTFQAENDRSLFSLWKKTDLSNNDTETEQVDENDNAKEEEGQNETTEGVSDPEIPPWMMLGGAVIAAGAIAVLALKKK